MAEAGAIQNTPRSGLLAQLYVQVIIAIVAGALIGYRWPALGTGLQPIADGFIKLIKMLLAPVIFGTIVVGIARMGSLSEVGRLGVKALIYFEVVSTIALVIGLLVINVLRPGEGMHIDPGRLDRAAIGSYVATATDSGGVVGFLLGIIPTTVADAFVRGAMLQVILVSVLFGTALVQMGGRATSLVDVIEIGLQALFRMIGMVMRLAPLGAGAGMAFTVGKFGLGAIVSLGKLMAAVYITSLAFVAIVLGAIAHWSGFPLLRLLRFIKDEVLVTFGTCSTEAVLPRLMVKLEQAGVARSTVGLVLPAGYTFNADGTCIYLTMAAIFVAQATDTPLTIGDQLTVLAVLLFTSKGSAGVAGAGFVTLAATLSSVQVVPVAGLVLLLGVDRFMNEARAVVNLIGNSVATIAVARWDGSFDRSRAQEIMRRQDAGQPMPPIASSRDAG